MDSERREALERRFHEINERLDRLRETGISPVEGVDAEFYRGQLLEELDEMEFELGVDWFERRDKGLS